MVAKNFGTISKISKILKKFFLTKLVSYICVLIFSCQNWLKKHFWRANFWHF